MQIVNSFRMNSTMTNSGQMEDINENSFHTYLSLSGSVISSFNGVSSGEDSSYLEKKLHAIN